MLALIKDSKIIKYGMCRYKTTLLIRHYILTLLEAVAAEFLLAAAFLMASLNGLPDWTGVGDGGR